jgi:hypothetical protein
MKRLILALCVLTSACATRHAADTGAWFADCYNKKRQETLLAQAEAQLAPDDLEGRRRLRRMFWDLQKECR